MNKKKYLYIFEPWKEWDYCGGAIGVISHSFNEAVNAICESDPENYKPKYFSNGIGRNHPKRKFNKRESWDSWVLTNLIMVRDQEEERIVFNNWNYA